MSLPFPTTYPSHTPPTFIRTARAVMRLLALSRSLPSTSSPGRYTGASPGRSGWGNGGRGSSGWIGFWSVGRPDRAVQASAYLGVEPEREAALGRRHKDLSIGVHACECSGLWAGPLAGSGKHSGLTKGPSTGRTKWLGTAMVGRLAVDGWCVLDGVA